MTDTTRSRVQIGLFSHIDPPRNDHGGYDIFVLGDVLTVVTGDGSKTYSETVDGLDKWRHGHGRQLSTGWGLFPDGSEVIYLYDAADGNFGYGMNLHHPDNGSEWGTFYAGGDTDD